MGLREIQRLKEQANEPKPNKRYPIPKVSKKRQQKLKDDKEMSKKDAEFYRQIWATALHRCENCGCKLPNTPSNWMFHHLLPKAQYPRFRHEPRNIMILCLECHSKAETNTDFAPKVKERREWAEKMTLK